MTHCPSYEEVVLSILTYLKSIQETSIVQAVGITGVQTQVHFPDVDGDVSEKGTVLMHIRHFPSKKGAV